VCAITIAITISITITTITITTITITITITITMQMTLFTSLSWTLKFLSLMRSWKASRTPRWIRYCFLLSAFYSLLSALCSLLSILCSQLSALCSLPGSAFEEMHAHISCHHDAHERCKLRQLRWEFEFS
jgi:hypothetical protein